jgi:hypothetical protein
VETRRHGRGSKEDQGNENTMRRMETNGGTTKETNYTKMEIE